MARRMIGAAVVLAAMVGAAAGAHAAAPGYHVVDKIPGPDGGWDYIRVDQKNNRVLMPRGTAVMAIDLATKKVTTGLAPGGMQHIALPLPGGREMLVTNGATQGVIFADLMTGAPIASVGTGKGPDSAGFDPKSGLVFVMGHSGGDVTFIDPKTHKAVATVDVGGTLEEGVSDNAGRLFVNVENKNEIAVIDIAKHQVTAHWPLAGCDGPTGLAYDAQDKLLISACDGVTELVRADNGKVQTLATGKGADGVAYDARHHLAFVPAGRDGTLSVIAFDKGVGRVAETVPTQRGARTIAVDDRTGRVYLPTATYNPPAPGERRPAVVPGSFQVLVVGP